MPRVPSDAGAVVLLRGDGAGTETYWVERGAGNAFLAGYRAFVGGRVEPEDAEVKPVGEIGGEGAAVGEGAAAGPLARLVAVAAVRELFEETGVLVARSDLPLEPAVLALGRADLARGRPFAEVLAGLGAEVDLGRLRPAGRWVTPRFAPRRFDTHFFLARLPAGQALSLAPGGELAAGDWVRPAAAIAAWERAEALVPPPVLHILRSLAAGLGPGLEARLLQTPGAAGAAAARIEFLPGVVVVPLRTDTLPPATTTNAPEAARALNVRQTLAHLERLERGGKVRRVTGGEAEEFVLG